MARPKYKAPSIGKKKKKRGSYSVSKDASGIRSKSAEISTPRGGSVGASKVGKAKTYSYTSPRGGSVGASKVGKAKTYSYTSPSGSSVGISKNPHSKGIQLTSRIGEQTYIDASADDQGTFNVGFRKKFKKGGKFRNFVRRNY